MPRLTRRSMNPLRVPILWLFLGPPVFRSISSRGALASLEGHVGFWNLVRIAWWMAFGLLAVWSLWHRRRALSRVLSDALPFLVWAGLWLASLYLSSLVSPAPKFTLADALMLTILAAASLDLALRLRERTLDAQSTLRTIFVLAWLLLLTALAVYVVSPHQVSVDKKAFGLRLLGGYVADVALLSGLVVLLALYLGPRASRGGRWWYLGAGLAGLVLVLLSQTRTVYISLAVGALILLGQSIARRVGRGRLLRLGIVSMTLGALVFVAVIPDVQGRAGPLEHAFVYLRRDNRSWETASGRFGIWTVLLGDSLSHPLGLGFSAGPRVTLQTSRWQLWHYGVIAKDIGNAHNMYVEVLAGTGYPGLFAWLGLLLWLLLRMFSVRGRSLSFVRAVFVVLLLNGLTGSEGVLPFMQASVMIWIVAGFLVGHELHHSHGSGAGLEES